MGLLYGILEGSPGGMGKLGMGMFQSEEKEPSNGQYYPMMGWGPWEEEESLSMWEKIPTRGRRPGLAAPRSSASLAVRPCPG